MKLTDEQLVAIEALAYRLRDLRQPEVTELCDRAVDLVDALREARRAPQEDDHADRD